MGASATADGAGEDSAWTSFARLDGPGEGAGDPATEDARCAERDLPLAAELLLRGFGAGDARACACKRVVHPMSTFADSKKSTERIGGGAHLERSEGGGLVSCTHDIDFRVILCLDRRSAGM